MRKVTRAARLNGARAKASQALSLFNQAAVDLEKAAETADAVAQDARQQAFQLSTLAHEAEVEATSARRNATKIKELFQ